MTPDEKVRKIKRQPQWIQDHIARLEKDIEYYRQQFLKTEEGQTSVKWTDYTNEKHLPDRGIIEYQLLNGSIEVSIKDDKLSLRASNHINNVLVILPAYSNSIYATIVKVTSE